MNMKIITFAVALALVAPSPALAAGPATHENPPSISAYGGPGADTQEIVRSHNAKDNRIVHQLPFTGADLTLVVLVGLFLVLLGFTLRRFTAVRQRQ